MVSANSNVSAIAVFNFGTEHAYDLEVCYFFLEIHWYVVVVDYIIGVRAFDALGCLVGAGPNFLSEASEFICIGHVPCWS